MVEIFKINQNIAMVTLLSFLNDAPDIISILVVSKIEERINFSLSILMGNGLFTTSFFIGLVVLKAKKISINSKMLNRNLILYLYVL